MNYNLNDIQAAKPKKVSTKKTLKSLFAYVTDERKYIYLAVGAIILNALLTLVGPLLIGKTIDEYVQTKNMHGVLVNSGILLIIYALAFFTNYLQTQLMGKMGQRFLYNLRNAVFSKLQELPVAFFNQNKSGDLISRINNDTEKLNQFFSQALMRFISSIAMMIGVGIFLLSIKPNLGAAALLPALFIFVFTKFISAWLKKKNLANLQTVGNMSAEVQESLDNFKTIIAFNRRDFFRRKFKNVNEENYKTAVVAGLANNLLLPVYTFFTDIALLIVLTYGIYLIISGSFTVGLLISFLAYANSFYRPLTQLSALWATFQSALAAWDRVSTILGLHSNLKQEKHLATEKTDTLLEFQNVHFGYDSKEILHDVNFKLEKGKSYAFIGPTGGGKTTGASLIARLYDPRNGTVLLKGKDIRSYSPGELSKTIGFILQDPFLFTGTLRENILYGNDKYESYSDEALEKLLEEANLKVLLENFSEGLQTQIIAVGDSISLGQKQIIAFIRAVMRNPDLLILDEATANIDTVTEQLLEEILNNLPKKTTRVTIAHRLNTIENADQIFFVNSGGIIPAGSMEQAMALLMENERGS